MHQHAQNLPVCAHCDGFPKAAVTTGQTTPNGRRETITADCPACHGTGHTTTPARAYARAGK
ncbi:hypothetical protein [Streptomyces sp. NBC_01180]|uniref:hypothetical protein n=1 Tax=Streptomyces sp. NBC_01180 TaxID=2903763 RepID=UPI00386639CC|nr:hypothetical protein OG708_13470 [Streptomyces sp. NBC_01180]